MITDRVHIFYTDDDPDDQLMFAEAVKEIPGNFQVKAQDNGDELLRLLKDYPVPFGIIFLDLNMPVKNGFDVLKEIRESALTYHIPVVILSTSVDAQAIQKSRTLGASLYIPKPSTFTGLNRAIQYALSINWESYTASPENFLYKVN